MKKERIIIIALILNIALSVFAIIVSFRAYSHAYFPEEYFKGIETFVNKNNKYLLTEVNKAIKLNEDYTDKAIKDLYNSKR